jgi:hypothetical protein
MRVPPTGWPFATGNYPTARTTAWRQYSTGVHDGRENRDRATQTTHVNWMGTTRNASR